MSVYTRYYITADISSFFQDLTVIRVPGHLYWLPVNLTAIVLSETANGCGLLPNARLLSAPKSMPDVNARRAASVMGQTSVMLK